MNLFPSETTCLLPEPPSAHSMESPVRRSYSKESLPLVSSYEDLRQSVELQLQALNSQSKSEAEIPNRRALGSHHAILLLFFGCSLSVFLFFLLYFEPYTPSSNSRSRSEPIPFSFYDPVDDLGLASFDRPKASAPPPHLFLDPFEIGNESLEMHRTYPTNAWYQNLLMVDGEPSNLHRAYSMPYLLDMVGLLPGIQIHPNHILASSDVLQLSFNEQFSLTIGAAPKYPSSISTEELSHRYRVAQTTELGVSLRWDAMHMESTIVKGMPYVTVEYVERVAKSSETGEILFPAIAAKTKLREMPIIDGNHTMECSTKGEKTVVKREIQLHFDGSDYTWLVFTSEPVWLECYSLDDSQMTFIQIVDSASDSVDENSSLIVRVALLNSCTTGENPVSCNKGVGDRLIEEDQVIEYADLLRQYSNYYPGKQTSVSYNISDDAREADLTFNWDLQTMTNGEYSIASRRLGEVKTEPSIITFALPHHLDKLDLSTRPKGIKYCKSSMHGPTCLVDGAIWKIKEDLPIIRLQAPRPPKPQFFQALAAALGEDIKFTLPTFFQRGAGDTYFSGKMLAKLARILLIAEELDDICDGKVLGANTEMYRRACNNVTLPTLDQRQNALAHLRSSVEVWINGTAETPFVYDEAWGGVVSCGCYFNGIGCKNRYPDCPGFIDQGLNFGNGFYNDQHFHYGYHIYGAAVVAHFDPAWGREHFEQVLLLVRNIANPSKDDNAFPLFRHKDWYQGSSWASGVPLPPYLNGKNQESSSEAIAAYESVALFGQVMREAWNSSDNFEKTAVSEEIEKVGRLLAATELRSTQKYWHVKRNVENEDIFPKAYSRNVVGILWSTMSQFGTWFGTAPYLPYGIQLLPLTPLSEARDELSWVNEMYYPFSAACSDSFQCTESGWSILQLAILATIGYAEEAGARVKELPSASFENAGGNGHSKSNTLWYIASRPSIEKPIEMDPTDFRGQEEVRPAPVFELKDCHVPQTCTQRVLDRNAGKYTCRERIEFLMSTEGSSQWEACSRVGGVEFVGICGLCNPSARSSDKKNAEDNSSTESADLNEERGVALQCPLCSEQECKSDLNRCPVYDRTFVCTQGASAGGCSGTPWVLEKAQCGACCEMTSCQRIRDEESQKITKDNNALDRDRCPPCKPDICYSKMNQCPIHTAPYICLDGRSAGGCSYTPWHLDGTDCSGCCEITIDC